MNKRIKIYISILAMVYGLMFGQYFIEGVSSFETGFKSGFNSSDLNKEGISEDMFYFAVKPSLGKYAYPEIQVSDNKTINLESGYYQAKVISKTNDVPLGYIIFFVLCILMTLPILGIMIYMPVLFIQIHNNVKKGVLLDNKVVRRISRMGWMIICCYCFELFVNFGMTYFVKQMIKLENYDIVYSFSNSTVLILGLITLILGEVLRTSLVMKEEQDLTI